MPSAPLPFRSVALTIIAWLALSAVLAGLYVSTRDSQPRLQDNDDVMRMVMVHDVLHGQPWQNQRVPRDNTPYGGQMHWSALVTLPIAGLAASLGFEAAAVAWPLLLLLPLMLLSLLAARRFAPGVGAITSALLIAFNITVVAEFVPGRVDHHNVQMVLVLAVLVAMLFVRKKGWGGALAGMLLSTCLAIGIETLPIVIGAGIAYAICWLLDPVEHKRGVLGFAGGLAAGMIGHLLFAMPAAQLLTVACDANSVVYVAAACLAALALALAALAASGRPFWFRLGLLCVLGAAAAAASAVLFPSCLAGPYANVDSRMLTEVFPQIPEVESFWRLVQESPQIAIPFGASALIALALAAWQAARQKGEARIDWVIVLCLLGAASAVMLLQIRGARLAAPLALPVAAWAIASMRQRYGARPGIAAAGALLASWLIFATWAQAFLFAAAGVVFSPARTRAEAGPSQSQCMLETSFAELAALPLGRVAVPYLLGPYVLLNTPHSILSAGYHRNGASLIDSLDFFRDDTRARAIAKERGLTLVAVCASQTAIIAELDRRPWLSPLPTSGPLKLCRIVL